MWGGESHLFFLSVWPVYPRPLVRKSILSSLISKPALWPITPMSILGSGSMKGAGLCTANRDGAHLPTTLSFLHHRSHFFASYGWGQKPKPGPLCPHIVAGLQVLVVPTSHGQSKVAIPDKPTPAPAPRCASECSLLLGHALPQDVLINQLQLFLKKDLSSLYPTTLPRNLWHVDGTYS